LYTTIATLKAQVKELQADKDRLDDFEKIAREEEHYLIVEVFHTGNVVIIYDDDYGKNFEGKTIREAIDKARS
jgi:hypothetical protein